MAMFIKIIQDGSKMIVRWVGCRGADRHRGKNFLKLSSFLLEILHFILSDLGQKLIRVNAPNLGSKIHTQCWIENFRHSFHHCNTTVLDLQNSRKFGKIFKAETLSLLI
jgi:hypothetical protein